MTNYSHKPVKWCLDLRKASSALESGIFKLCHGSMAPFVTYDKKSPGPEGEINPNDSFQLMVLFSPDAPGVYDCQIPIIVNDKFEQPYYNIQITGELLSPKLVFDPSTLILKPIPLGLTRTEKIVLKAFNYER